MAPRSSCRPLTRKWSPQSAGIAQDGYLARARVLGFTFRSMEQPYLFLRACLRIGHFIFETRDR